MGSRKNPTTQSPPAVPAGDDDFWATFDFNPVPALPPGLHAAAVESPEPPAPEPPAPERAEPPKKKKKSGPVWPDEVPVLVGDDLCRGPEPKGDKRSLWNWLTSTFTDQDAFELAAAELEKQLRLVFRTKFKGSIAVIGDQPGAPTEKLAQCWTAMLRGVGYKV